jgi:uncharacterized protein (DUF58 family)
VSLPMMTGRGWALLVGGPGLVAWGWFAGWPEVTALGAAGVALVVLALLVVGPAPRAGLKLPDSSTRVVRGESAMVPLSVTGSRRRGWLRVTDGRVALPRATYAVPRDGVLKLALDTSRRGQWPIGPYSLVHGDPWGIRRRVVAVASGGTVTVLPRVHAVHRQLLSRETFAETELSSRRAGDQHFHALRDYVLGDEPRMVHWRSSARAGRLVVRQHVAAATTGTTVVLDTDASAYGSDEQFGSGWVEERFEQAVEVAASLVSSSAFGTEQVSLVTTSLSATPVTAPSGAVARLLDHLAVVEPVPPVGSMPEELPAVVKRARAAQVIVVTGTPSQRTMTSVRRLARGGVRVNMVRVGANGHGALAGLRVVDVERAEQLV